MVRKGLTRQSVTFSPTMKAQVADVCDRLDVTESVALQRALEAFWHQTTMKSVEEKLIQISVKITRIEDTMSALLDVMAPRPKDLM